MKVITWAGQIGNTAEGFSFPAILYAEKYNGNRINIHISCKCEGNTNATKSSNILNMSVIRAAFQCNSIDFSAFQTRVTPCMIASDRLNAYRDNYAGRTGLHLELTGNYARFGRAYNENMAIGGWGNEVALYTVGGYFEIDVWGATFT